MSAIKYTKELLEPIVSASLSLAEVIKRLGLRQSGGTQHNIKRWIKNYELNTSHFLGQRRNRGPDHKGAPKGLPWQEVLVFDENRDARRSHRILQRALREMGRKYECEGCGNIGDWMGKKLTLQIDHKNGDWRDDRAENLRYQCPNCHSTTENWSGKGIKNRTLS